MLKKNETQNNFNVPYHVHNGIDSPKLSAEVINFNQLEGISSIIATISATIPNTTGTTITGTLTGARFGNLVLLGNSANLQGVTVTAYVSAIDTISIRLQNNSGGSVTFTSLALTVVVLVYP